MREQLRKQLEHIKTILRNGGIIESYIFELDYEALKEKIEREPISSKLVKKIEDFFMNSIDREIRLFSSEDILNDNHDYIEELRRSKKDFMIE